LVTNRSAKTRLSSSEREKPEGRSAYRKRVLRAIETALDEARSDAQAIEYPVLVYFLEMAIVELNRGADPLREGSHQQQATERVVLLSERTQP
jgi:hypothetical protein